MIALIVCIVAGVDGARGHGPGTSCLYVMKARACTAGGAPLLVCIWM